MAGQPPLHGLRVVVDCAHGAAYSIGPRALRRAGAEVIAIGAAPDGENINAGVGSTHLETLAAAVLEHGADAGLAFDGDADRCLAVDGDGQPLDGDQILAVLASQLKRSSQLVGDTVVVTVMSNLGFHDAMRESGITVIETPVGDKHVYAAMRDGGYILGGEQSGHIIQMGHATTGDGVLTGLHLLAAVNSIGIPVSAAGKMMTRYPQVLINVRGDKDRAMADPALAEAVSAAKSKLGDAGRVLLRPSGTEPVIRVMVETRQSEVAEQVAGQLADAVRRRCHDRRRRHRRRGHRPLRGRPWPGPKASPAGCSLKANAACPRAPWRRASRPRKPWRRRSARRAACSGRDAEVVVRHRRAGRASEVSGTVAAAAARLGVTHWHLSLSHDAGIASAVVIARRRRQG